MNFIAVIFDLDGTLLDTLGDLCNSVNRVLASNGFPTHPVDSFKSFIGDGALKLIERVLPEGSRSEEMLVQYYNEFRKDYGENWNVETKAYDEIAEMLDTLCDQGIRLAVLSNKPHECTVKCVDAYLSGWPFEVVLGQKNEIPKKPDPAGAIMIARQMEISPSDFLFLGDSGVDMKTADAAEMFPAGALWGFRPEAELIASGAKALLKNPLDLFSLPLS